MLFLQNDTQYQDYFFIFQLRIILVGHIVIWWLHNIHIKILVLSLYKTFLIKYLYITSLCNQFKIRDLPF